MNSEYNDLIRSVPFGTQYQYVDNHSEKYVVLTDFVNVEIPHILFCFPGDQQAIPVVNDGMDRAAEYSQYTIGLVIEFGHGETH